MQCLEYLLLNFCEIMAFKIYFFRYLSRVVNSLLHLVHMLFVGVEDIDL